MRHFNDWFLARRDYFTLLAAVIISLILMFSNAGRQMDTIRVWSLASFGFLMEKFTAFSTFFNVYEENHRLRLQNAELMIENSRLQEAYLENQRLRQLLELKAQSRWQLVATKVIGKQEDNFINSIILDAGTDHGVTKNMAVITAQGLVGKVLQVSDNRSIVQLLLDRNFRVSAMVQRSRVAGITKWISGERVLLAEIPKRSDVAIGDNVITSGLSSIFPAGLNIGQISTVNENKRSMFLTIEVEPSVDFNKLEEVLVVKGRELAPQSE